MTPTNLLAIRTYIRPAAAKFQVHDAISFRLDGQDAMTVAHACMDRGDEPLAIRRPVERVEMMHLLVDVLTGLARLEIVNEQSLGSEVRVGELVELTL